MGNKNTMKTIYPQEIKKRIEGNWEKDIKFGYDGNEKHIEREVGEEWTDKDGRTWIQREGYIVKVTRFDDLRTPLFCPECQKRMGKAAKDSEVFHKFGFCLNCLIERDAKMMRDGSYYEYEKNYIKSKQVGYYTEMKMQITEFLKSVKNGIEFPQEDGRMEKWSGDMTKLREMWNKELEFVNKELEKLEIADEEK